jgi:hypothetical protein
VQAPSLDGLLELLFPTRQAFGGFSDRPDVFWEDHVLRGGGTDHLAAPPEVGRAPGGSACLAEIVAEPDGLKPELRGLEGAEGLFTGTGEVPHGFLFHGGTIHLTPRHGGRF